MNKNAVIGVVVALLVIGGGFALLNGNNPVDTVTDTVSDVADDAVDAAKDAGDAVGDAAGDAVDAAQDAVTMNVVEKAVATDDLSTLVAAVQKADLVDTLSGDGPFTVFAPTNDAFAALLANLDVTADQLLARDDLGDILTYHVVSGKVMAADLTDGQMVKTVQGGMLEVSVSDAGVTLTDANGGVSTVTTADVAASNGVVHIVDSVVLP